MVFPMKEYKCNTTLWIENLFHLRLHHYVIYSRVFSIVALLSAMAGKVNSSAVVAVRSNLEEKRMNMWWKETQVPPVVGGYIRRSSRM